MKIQLWAYVPGSDDHVILADPLSLEAIFVLSDVGSMQLTYPLNTPHADLLNGMSGGNFVGCDVEVRVWNDSAWILAPQGRFEVTDYEDDFTSQRDMPTRTYTLQSWSARPLWSVRQGKITGLNDQGARDFINKSRGEIVGILIGEAQARGDVPNLTYLNSAGAGGDALSIPPGQTLQDILANARDEGVLEWLMVADASDQGRKLVCYSSLGTDLSDSVVLQDGLDIRQAPSHWSTQDMVQAVLVQGDDNSYVVSVSPDAASPYGKNMDFVTASGITDPTALDLIGQARLEKGKQPRVEHTRELIFDNARFLPFINYSLGDTILAPAISGEMQPLRVRQITLTLDSDGISGNLVLGDRFTERALQIERATRGITSGAGSMGGSGTLPDNTQSQIDTALDAYDSVVQGIVSTKVRYLPYAPGGAAGQLDDTWFQTDGVKTTAIWKHNGSGWVQNPIDQAALRVGYLSALSADLGNVNAGTITGVTITGGLISGADVKGGRLFGGDFAYMKAESIFLGAGGGHVYEGLNLRLYYADTAFGGPVALSGDLRGEIDSITLRRSNVRYINVSDAEIYMMGQVRTSTNLTVGGNLSVSGSFSPSSISTGPISGSSLGLTGDANISGSVKAQGNLEGVLSSNTGYPTVIWNSSNRRLYYQSSVSALKLDQQPLGVHYEILDLQPITYIDRSRRDEDEEYAERSVGFVAEHVRDQSVLHGGLFDPLLIRHPETGELLSLAYERWAAFLTPVIRDMNERLKALEEK